MWFDCTEEAGCLVKTLYLLQKIAHWDFFFLLFSAMGRRPEINHSQLQGKQRQSDDMPQETVSFVCNTSCSQELSTKCSDYKVKTALPMIGPILACLSF